MLLVGVRDCDCSKARVQLTHALSTYSTYDILVLRSRVLVAPRQRLGGLSAGSEAVALCVGAWGTANSHTVSEHGIRRPSSATAVLLYLVCILLPIGG